jgi:hypothetical protein
MDAYGEALVAVEKVGGSRCSDAEAMALFCDTSLQLLVGAVSPRLVWSGAQARGLTFRELTKIVHDNPLAVNSLQWEGSVNESRRRATIRRRQPSSEGRRTARSSGPSPGG